MTPNVEQHCQAVKDNYADPTIFIEYNANEWDVEDDEEDDWKRLTYYISGIILFFYVLFKYLI